MGAIGIVGLADAADIVMVHVIVIDDGVVMPDGMVQVQGIVMDDDIAVADGLGIPDGIGMVHVIDSVVVEDRCMVQLGDTLGVPVGPDLAFAGAARAVREIVAAARAAAAM